MFRVVYRSFFDSFHSSFQKSQVTGHQGADPGTDLSHLMIEILSFFHFQMTSSPSSPGIDHCPAELIATVNSYCRSMPQVHAPIGTNNTADRKYNASIQQAKIIKKQSQCLIKMDFEFVCL